MKIYHNPRCSKSRQGLAILKESGKDFEIIDYLKNPVTYKELEDIIDKLGISPIELIRKNEAVWKQEFKGKDLTNKELIEAMCAHPKLIERPIVIKGEKGVIGRPPEKIRDLV
jgi:arsenate reductase